MVTFETKYVKKGTDLSKWARMLKAALNRLSKDGWTDIRMHHDGKGVLITAQKYELTAQDVVAALSSNPLPNVMRLEDILKLRAQTVDEHSHVTPSEEDGKFIDMVMEKIEPGTKEIVLRQVPKAIEIVARRMPTSTFREHIEKLKRYVEEHAKQHKHSDCDVFLISQEIVKHGEEAVRRQVV